MTLDPTSQNRRDEQLVRGEGAALWRQISDTLRAEIQAGAYEQEDGRLPTERELTTRFGVNRHTVRRALGALAEIGLVRTEQGRGVFVNAELLAYPLGRRVRFTESLKAQQRTPRGDILEIVREGASSDVAAALGLPIGAPIWRVERCGFAEDRPISLASHYFSVAMFPAIDQAFRQSSSITQALAGMGVPDYERQETRIVARPATAEETRILDLARGRPVLVTEAVNIDKTGRIIEYGVCRFAADRVQLVV